MKLDIVSPEKIYFSGEVSSVSLPGTMGEFSILDYHAPLISALDKGRLIYKYEDKILNLEIGGGFVEVNKNKIIVCIESTL
jgi:F-type H+-transporting ATPase subunit epsilon